MKRTTHTVIVMGPWGGTVIGADDSAQACLGRGAPSAISARRQQKCDTADFCQGVASAFDSCPSPSYGPH